MNFPITVVHKITIEILCMRFHNRSSDKGMNKIKIMEVLEKGKWAYRDVPHTKCLEVDVHSQEERKRLVTLLKHQCNDAVYRVSYIQ